MKKFITTSALAILSVASSVGAQSASSTTGTGGTGLPNTGFGGDALINIALLVVSAIIAVGAGVIALRKKNTAF